MNFGSFWVQEKKNTCKKMQVLGRQVRVPFFLEL